MRVYTVISLGICGGKFPYIQKSFFAYAEIYFRIYGNLAAHIQKFFRPIYGHSFGGIFEKG